tara:strand:+ start:3137 stop:3334 length:198 start_codon:yes stop_codon:yes gene_type:complete
MVSFELTSEDTFIHLPVPQQIMVVKELANMVQNTGDIHLHEKLLLLIRLLEVPEIIGINEIEGLA